MLQLLEARPDLWSRWYAGKTKTKGKTKTSRKGEVNDEIVRELLKRRAPTSRTASGVNSYVSSDMVSVLTYPALVSVR